MAVFLAPAPIIGTHFTPGGNTPTSGGLLFSYITGSSTKQNTFTDSTGATPRTNPIVLDSGGNIPSFGEVWLTQGVVYRFVLAPSNDTDPPTSPLWTMDGISGINDPTGIGAGGEWVAFAGTPTFAGATSFTVTGDQTGTFTVGRRVKSTNTAGTIFSTILTSAFAAGVTTVTVVNDSGVLDAGLSVVSYGSLSTPNGSIPFTKITSVGLDHSLASVTTGALSVTSSIFVGTTLRGSSTMLSPITNSLSSDVILNSTAVYFDGPSIAQGTSGTWFVNGTVTVIDTALAAGFSAKLWDGTKVISSAQAVNGAAAFQTTIPLSGFIVSPSGNLKISVKDASSTTGKILFNASGNSTDSTITAVRIG